MRLTKKIIKTLPLITEEELKALRQPKEELIAKAIVEFNQAADEIDAMYDTPDQNQALNPDGMSK